MKEVLKSANIWKSYEWRISLVFLTHSVYNGIENNRQKLPLSSDELAYSEV